MTWVMNWIVGITEWFGFSTLIIVVIYYFINICLVSVFNSTIKMYILCRWNWLLKKFWISYLVDFVTYIFMIITYVYVDVVDDESILKFYYFQFFIMAALMLHILVKPVDQVKDSIDSYYNNKFISRDVNLNEEILKNMANSFRTLVFILASVVIFAVDLPNFPVHHHKTNSSGLSLMDTGVGFFVLCNSLRTIRVYFREAKSGKFTPTKRSFFRIVQNSSPLLFIGILRIAFTKKFAYNYNIHEYGYDWNFFLTIFCVRILAYPLEHLVQNDYKRTFALSALIGIVYQYFLTAFDYSCYISMINDDNLFERNKPGLFSTIGYLSLYLCGKGVSLRILSVLNGKELEKNSLVLFLKLTLNLVAFGFFFWFATDNLRTNFQYASRKLCNLTFICMLMTLFSGTLMILAIFYLTLSSLFLIKFSQEEVLSHGIYGNDKPCTYQKIHQVLNASTMFQRKVDSKYVGLIIFLISNVITSTYNVVNSKFNHEVSMPRLYLSIDMVIASFFPMFFANLIGTIAEKLAITTKTPEPSVKNF